MELIALLIYYTSYRAVAVCLASVPLTHAVGVYLHCPRPTRPWQYLLFPFTGGNRHVVLQLFGWLLWSFSLLTILPVWLSSLPFVLSPNLPIIPNTHVDVVSGAAAAVSFIGELFMIKALLVYGARGGGGGADAGPTGGSGTSCTSGLPAQHTALRGGHVVVVVLGVLLTTTGVLLLMALEYMPDLPSRVLYCCLSLSCLLIAASTTYGLGGFLAHGQHGRHGGGDSGWQFFQPFSGGSAFVATQALGWGLFSAAVVLIVTMLWQLVAGVAQCVRCWALGAGTLMMAAQALLAISVYTFRGKAASRLISVAGLSIQSSAAAGRSALTTCLPIALMYLPVHTLFLLWTLSFSFLPGSVAAAAWLAFLVPYYVLTTRGAPHHTGCRRWPWLCAFMSRHMTASLEAWFGSVQVIMDSQGSMDGQGSTDALGTPLQLQQPQQPGGRQRQAEQPPPRTAAGDKEGQAGARQQGAQHPPPAPASKYIFGFQPHGLYPTGAGFLPLLPAFRRLFPGVTAVTLTASIMYFPPFVRDVVCWAGSRQVARHSFLRALDETGAVVICPGGQAELVHTQRAFRAQPSSSGGSPAGGAAGGSAAGDTGVLPAAEQAGRRQQQGQGRLQGQARRRQRCRAVPAEPLRPLPEQQQAQQGQGRRMAQQEAQQPPQQQGQGRRMAQQPPQQQGQEAQQGQGQVCEREIVLITRHKGFVKIAVEHQAALVPVLAIGETLQLRNLFDWPTLQQYTYRRLGFPVPFVMVGRWGVSPLPRRVPLLYIIGQPIRPPPHQPGTPADPGVVDALHAAYYARLVSMFQRYSHLHPDYKNARLVLATE